MRLGEVVGGIAMLRRSISAARTLARLVQARNARQEDRDEIVARRRRRVDVEDQLQQLRHFRIGDAIERHRVARRLDAVERVLAGEIDHGFVDERVAEARHLHERAAVRLRAGRQRARREAAGRGPHADDRVRIGWRSPASTPPRAARDFGTLNRERADVEAGGAVFDVARADAEQVEDAEIDVEALVALAGEHA